MKCLSVRQPWAWLIVSGIKNVENRMWQTNYRGPLLIHAGKSFDCDALAWLWDNALSDEAEEVIEHFSIMVKKERSFDFEPVEMGGIVGQVNLDGIVKCSLSRWAMPDCYHWLVSGAKELPFQPMEGRLQLFEVES